MAVARDGRRAVTGSSNQELKVWDLEARVLVRTIPAAGWASSLVIDSTGRNAIGVVQPHLRTWDLATGEPVRTLTPGKGLTLVCRLDLSADGATAFACDREAGLLIDMSTGSVRARVQIPWGNFGGKFVPSVGTFTPDGRSLVAGTADIIAVFDVATGRQQRLLRPGSGQGFDLRDLFFSPDGRTLFEARQVESSVAINVWDYAAGRVVRSFRHAGDKVYNAYVRYRALRDGRHALVGWAHSPTLPVRLLDLQAGAFVATLEGSAYPFEASKSGDRIITGTNYEGVPETTTSELRLWASDGALQDVLAGSASQVGAVAPVGPAHVAIAIGRAAGVWHLGLGRREAAFLVREHGDLRSISQAGAHAVTETVNAEGRERVFRLVDTTSGQVVRSAQVQVPSSGYFALSRIDGYRILVAEPRGTVHSLDFSRDAHPLARPLAIKAEPKSGDRFGFLAVSADHKFIAGREQAKVGSFWVWNAGTGDRLSTTFVDPAIYKIEYRGGQRVRAPFSGAYSGDATKGWFTPDGSRLVTFGRDEDITRTDFGSRNSVKIWDTATGRLLRTALVGAGGAYGFSAFAASEDGRSAYLTGGDLFIWHLDLETGAVLRKSDPLASDCRSLVLMPGGDRLLATLASSYLVVLDAKALSPLAYVVGSSTGEWLTMTPQGFFAASPNGTGLLRAARGFDSIGISQIHQSLYNPDLVSASLAGDKSGEVRAAASVVNLEKVLDSGPAPEVVITSPAAGSAVSTDTIDVSVRITDRGKGVGRVEWRVNGVTAAVSAPLPGHPKEQELSRPLALDLGSNHIEVAAYNEGNVLASRPASITLSRATSSEGRRPVLHVLAIGINAYVDPGHQEADGSSSRFKKLHLAVNDAVAFAAAMRRAAEGQYEATDIIELLDQEATAGGIERAIDRIAETAHPRDTFILFVAAHGTSMRGRYFLIPQDFTSGPDALQRFAVGQDQLQEWVSRIKARRAVLLLDTCESGALVSGYAQSRTEVNASESAIGRLHEATGRPVLTAAASGRPAYEGFQGHGVFTWALLDALKHGDRNANGIIELSELVAHVQIQVPKISASLSGRGFAAVAAKTSQGDRQSAHFGSRGDDFGLVGAIGQ